MDSEQSKRIIDALAKKSANKPCPRCGNTDFDALAESYLPIEGTGGWLSSDVPLPIALIACRRCGFVSIHASGPLLDSNPEGTTEVRDEPVVQPT